MCFGLNPAQLEICKLFLPVMFLVSQKRYCCFEKNQAFSGTTTSYLQKQPTTHVILWLTQPTKFLSFRCTFAFLRLKFETHQAVCVYTAYPHTQKSNQCFHCVLCTFCVLLLRFVIPQKIKTGSISLHFTRIL